MYDEYVELLAVVAIVLALISFFRVRALNARVQHMEKYLQRSTLSETVMPPVTGLQQDVSGEEVVHTAPTVTPVATPAFASHSSIDDFLAWCRRDWLMKLGGLLVLLGMGWFVSYAFMNNWIGPIGRITLGLVAGALVLVLGRYRMQRALEQGSILMFVGAVTVVTTLYAARFAYDFFTPASVLIVMFGTSALLGITSVRMRHKPLAYANALLAALAPLLTAAPDPSVAGLFSYLFVVTLGALAIVRATGWRHLVVIALAVVGIYSLPLLVTLRGADKDIGLLFAFAFTGVFFIAALSAMYRTSTAVLADTITALGSGLFLLVWILTAAPREWQSLLLIAWAIVFAFGAFFLFKKTTIAKHFYLYGGVAALYIAAATGLEFDGAILAIIAILESATAIALGYLVTRKESVLVPLSLTFIIPLLLSIEHITASSWDRSPFHADAAVLVLLMVVLGTLAGFFRMVERSYSEKQIAAGTLANVAWIVFGAYALIWTWLTMHAILPGELGTIGALFLYALVASGLYMAGKQNSGSWQRIAAGVLFGIVVLRLLFVEVWQMGLGGRIVTFLCIGVLLMVVAWLERSSFDRSAHKNPDV